MSIEQLVKDLKINKAGSYSKDKSYVIDLESSDEFGRMYSILDRNDNLTYMEDYSLLTPDNSSLIYQYNREYQIALIADFKNDTYKIVIQEL